MKTKLLTAAAVVAPFIAICLLGVSRAQTYDWSGAYAGINAEAHGAKRARVTLLARRRLTGLIRTVLLAAGTSATESKATSSLLDLKPTWRGGSVPEKRRLRFRTASISRPTKSSKIGSELFDRVSDSP